MASGSRDGLSRRRARERWITEKIESFEIPGDLSGKPLKIPNRNFKIPLEERIQSRFGPPGFAVRARRIESAVQKLMRDLEEEYAELSNRLQKKPVEFSTRWTESVKSVDLDEINDLIEKHNKYYPLEAGLRQDPETGVYYMGSSPWKPQERLTPEKILKMFPPCL